MIEPRTHWHLDKSVPVTIILTLATQIIVGVWWASKLDARIERLEQFKLEQLARDTQQDATARDAVSILRGDIKEVGAKVDRLIERQGEKGAK